MNPRSHERFVKDADESLEYYQVQATPDANNSMWLGLFMSKQWRKMLEDAEPDVGEVRLLFKALEKGGDIHGIAWHYMSLSVGWWLESLEERDSSEDKQ